MYMKYHRYVMLEHDSNPTVRKEPNATLIDCMHVREPNTIYKHDGKNIYKNRMGDI